MRRAISGIVKGEVPGFPTLPSRVILCGHSMGGLIMSLLSNDDWLSGEFKASNKQLEGLLLLCPAFDTNPILPQFRCCPYVPPTNFCSPAHACTGMLRFVMKSAVQFCQLPLLPKLSPSQYCENGLLEDSDEYKDAVKGKQLEVCEPCSLETMFSLMREMQKNHWKQKGGNLSELPLLLMCAEADSSVPCESLQEFAKVQELEFSHSLAKDEIKGNLRYCLSLTAVPHLCLMDGIRPVPDDEEDWTRSISLPSIQNWVQGVITKGDPRPTNSTV